MSRNARRAQWDVVSRGIREFVDRDWASARRSKDDYWRRGLMPSSGDRTWRHTPESPSFFVVPVQPAAIELLQALAPVLVRWGRWYLFGAQAVTVYGVPRLSADVDVTALKECHNRTPIALWQQQQRSGR